MGKDNVIDYGNKRYKFRENRKTGGIDFYLMGKDGSERKMRFTAVPTLVLNYVEYKLKQSIKSGKRKAGEISDIYDFGDCLRSAVDAQRCMAKIQKDFPGEICGFLGNCGKDITTAVPGIALAITNKKDRVVGIESTEGVKYRLVDDSFTQSYFQNLVNKGILQVQRYLDDGNSTAYDNTMKILENSPFVDATRSGIKKLNEKVVPGNDSNFHAATPSGKTVTFSNLTPEQEQQEIYQGAQKVEEADKNQLPLETIARVVNVTFQPDLPNIPQPVSLSGSPLGPPTDLPPPPEDFNLDVPPVPTDLPFAPPPPFDLNDFPPPPNPLVEVPINTNGTPPPINEDPPGPVDPSVPPPPPPPPSGNNVAFQPSATTKKPKSDVSLVEPNKDTSSIFKDITSGNKKLKKVDHEKLKREKAAAATVKPGNTRDQLLNAIKSGNTPLKKVPKEQSGEERRELERKRRKEEEQYAAAGGKENFEKMQKRLAVLQENSDEDDDASPADWD
jgi:hypothetical protein